MFVGCLGACVVCCLVLVVGRGSLCVARSYCLFVVGYSLGGVCCWLFVFVC